jgi:hypothetical protein
MKVQNDVIEPAVVRPFRSCLDGRHADPARLGQTDGAEWWHCRRCGDIWQLGALVKATNESPERWKR